ncbi:MAG: bifunctional hydroxymethylpyrimidine kinase/phosphomethylpyrimidine kinase [Gemmatimonadota bacterium]
MRRAAPAGGADIRPSRPPVALTVAGSDSGGGAGIQADIRTFHAFGVFGTCAVTALTAQDTTGVRAVREADPEIVASQIRAVLEDLKPAAVKTGMLPSADVVRRVGHTLREAPSLPLVVDPVVAAASGHRLATADALDAIRAELLPAATLVTPNLDEAEALSGARVRDPDGMREAALRIAQASGVAVLVKGGHLAGSDVVDLLYAGGEWLEWRSPRRGGGTYHGTGCTLSAAIAAGLALGRTLEAAVGEAIEYVRRAIRTAPALGRGSPPLDHWAPAGGMAGGDPAP